MDRSIYLMKTDDDIGSVYLAQSSFLGDFEPNYRTKVRIPHSLQLQLYETAILNYRSTPLKPDIHIWITYWDSANTGHWVLVNTEADVSAVAAARLSCTATPGSPHCCFKKEKPKVIRWL